MLAIKFRRIGKKHQPSYRIVVSEKRSKMSSFVEDLGWYNPISKEYKIDKERAAYRLKTGCQPTDSIYNLLVKAGIVSSAKRPVHKIAKKPAEMSATTEVSATPATA